MFIVHIISSPQIVVLGYLFMIKTVELLIWLEVCKLIENSAQVGEALDFVLQCRIVGEPPVSVLLLCPLQVTQIP